jgi:hypothetical protein
MFAATGRFAHLYGQQIAIHMVVTAFEEDRFQTICPGTTMRASRAMPVTLTRNRMSE